VEHLNVVVHEGRGPYALLVHGVLASRGYWADNLDALSAACRPVVVELWGHGRSPSPADPARYEWESYCGELERVREDLGAEQWFTIGQSMGAGLTLNYGLMHPDRVLAQVVTNSNGAFAPLEGWSDRHATGVGPFVDKLRREGTGFLRTHRLNPGRSRRVSEATRALLDREIDEHDALGVANAMAITTARMPLGNRLTQVTRPTLLTLGVDEEPFLRLLPQARLIPDLEIVELPASHAVNAHDPDGWNAAVVDFFIRHAPG
jgi:2-succinyl-6-hydroxy-2,4-cyclohexadiene-1-carboxylate synthase